MPERVKNLLSAVTADNLAYYLYSIDWQAEGRHDPTPVVGQPHRGRRHRP
jgi:hypothetical protein